MPLRNGGGIDISFNGPPAGFSTSPQHADVFLTLEPETPHQIMSTKLGPYPGPGPHRRGQAPDARNHHWSIGDELESGATYRFGVKENSEISWWDEGSKDHVLGTWWGDKVLGRSWLAKKEVPIDSLEKKKRLPLVVLEEPTFTVLI